MNEGRHERRAKSRFPMELPIVISPSAALPEMAGTTRDVSSCGVFFYVDAWPERLSQIEFALMFSESTRVSCRGCVVRVEELVATGKTGVAATIDSHDLAS